MKYWGGLLVLILVVFAEARDSSRVHTVLSRVDIHLDTDQDVFGEFVVGESVEVRVLACAQKEDARFDAVEIGLAWDPTTLKFQGITPNSEMSWVMAAHGAADGVPAWEWWRKGRAFYVGVVSQTVPAGECVTVYSIRFWTLRASPSVGVDLLLYEGRYKSWHQVLSFSEDVRGDVEGVWFEVEE